MRAPNSSIDDLATRRRLRWSKTDARATSFVFRGSSQPPQYGRATCGNRKPEAIIFGLRELLKKKPFVFSGVVTPPPPPGAWRWHG